MSGRVGRVVLLGGDGFEPMRRTGRFAAATPPVSWLDAKDRRVPVYGPDGKGPATMVDPLESADFPGQIARPGERTRIQELEAQGCVVRWPAITETTDAEPANSDDHPCHVCSARFASHTRLVRHVQIHHPDAPPPPVPPPAPEPAPGPEPEPTTPDEIRDLYANDPLVSERETPFWLRD